MCVGDYDLVRAILTDLPLVSFVQDPASGLKHLDIEWVTDELTINVSDSSA